MALVTISTIYQTVNIAIIILISKGWLYVRSVLTKDDLSWLTMFMGLFYLTYSAMFVTANIPRMQLFIKVWMNCLYALIFLYTFYQCFSTKFQVHAQFQVFEIMQSRRALRNPLYQALSLRLYMINSFMFITSVFYLN